ncbi:ABC transporter permease [Paenibacillus dendrobii]
MVFYFTRSEIRNRYKGSILGVLWALLNPLFLLILYSFVFSFVMKVQITHYLLFLFAGLVPWLCFKSSILSSSGSIVGNGGLIKKIYFPREILIITSILGNFVNMFIGLLLIVPLLFIYKMGININYLFLPLIILIQFLFSLSIGLVISALTVFVRDLRQILDIIMMGLFYTTPIVYRSEMIPEKIKLLFRVNPIAIIIKSYQDIIYHGVVPDILSLTLLGIVSIILLFIAFKIFNRLNRWFAEHI